MTTKQRILLSVMVLLLGTFLYFIIAGDHGLSDLNRLKKAHTRLVEENRRLARENLSISVAIDRLRHDPEYIEHVARQDLGMIAEDEIVLKPGAAPVR